MNMATKKQRRTGVEWAGGRVVLPGYVTGEGKPYRPEAIFWIGQDGAVLGSTVMRPGEALGRAAASLRSAIEKPLCGRPHAPARVRVAAPDLAEVLRDAHPQIEFVCAPTPEIDEVLAMLREKAAEDAEAEVEPSYLSPEIEPGAVAALFRAAAGAFRARPWEVVPSDQAVVSVTIEALGLREAVMSVIGQSGQSFGWILFSEFGDFQAYLDAAEAIEREDDPSIPPHVALNFERGAELPAALRKEIATHRWEVAGPDAAPWLVAIDEDLVQRPLTADDVTIAEAIALALPEVLSEQQALHAAWDGGAPVVRSVAVTAHAGELEVVLRVPYERPQSGVFDRTQGAEGINPEALRKLAEELERRFATSPEARALPEVQFCGVVMDLAASHFGAPIAALGATELRQLVFEILPSKVSIDASAARGILEEMRAFYGFLAREFELAQADACRRVLGGDAGARLEAAMSDTSKFGMAKAIVMAGREAGFDVDSKEGFEAWMRVMQAQPLPASIRLPSVDGALRAARPAAQAKQARRKATRKARKKNR
jgi:hypothetical protein